MNDDLQEQVKPDETIQNASDSTQNNFSLARTLGGVVLARYVQKHLGLVILISILIFFYITNRYICQKKIIEISKVEAKIVKARFKATVCSSELTEKTRESNIMKLLSNYGDSTLVIPNDPPYLIKVPKINN